jgi:hypothetical protein
MKSSGNFLGKHPGMSKQRKLLSCKLTCVIYPRHGQRRKHSSTVDYTENTSHVITKHCWGVMSLCIRKMHGHKVNTAAVMCDVTAYAVVCLPSRCLETGCGTPLLSCCVCVLATSLSVAQQFLLGANTPQC